MYNLFFLAILLLSICAGLYAILITYRLHKQYRENYLSTYLYFQIFMTVFGVYGIAGRLIAKELLSQQASSFQTIESIGHFFTFLGVPFLIFAWYMFIRLCRELIGKKLSRTFNLSYFFVLILIFLVYGSIIVLINVSELQEEAFALLASTVKLVYGSLEVLVLGTGLSQLFIHTRQMKDEVKKRAVHTFAYLNMIAFCLSLFFLLHAHQGRMLSAAFLFIFFSRNIPPVLYWKSYLRKNIVAPSLQEVEDQTLRDFFDEHKISKREEEVIGQLCEGKSNKEIGKALYISLQTVKDHIYRIYQKTDVKNRVQLINLIQGYKSKEKD
jgi:DNA-binding CsgD family transcriptional regulator